VNSSLDCYDHHARFIREWIEEVIDDASKPIPYLDLYMITAINNAVQRLMDCDQWCNYSEDLGPLTVELQYTLDRIWPGWPESCLRYEVSDWGVSLPGLAVPVADC